MKLIESSVQIIEEKDPYKMIELAGRTCYRSENNITEDSAKEFVDRMIKLGHGAMLEHGTIYLTIAKTAMNIGDPIFYVRNKYSKVNEDDYFYYITTNMRVIVENNRLDDLQYQVEPTEHHEKRITAKFTLSRSIANEFVRLTMAEFKTNITIYFLNEDYFSSLQTPGHFTSAIYYRIAIPSILQNRIKNVLYKYQLKSKHVFITKTL